MNGHNGKPASRFHVPKKWRAVLGALIILGTGIMIGRGSVPQQTQVASYDHLQLRAEDPSYKFIKPLLACNRPELRESREFTPLKTAVQQLIEQKIQKNNPKTVSVYFRDMNNGRWMGINENDVYDPASLLKVPVMIAWLKEGESDPAIFQKKLLYPGIATEAPQEEFRSLAPNTWHTVDELLTAMIVRSDNDAKDLLIASLDRRSLDETFSNLGIAVVGNDLNTRYVISAKAYSLFFRVLYNATYLTRELSEKALNLLSRSEFQEGLAAGTPPNTVVAHKFGQYGAPDVDVRTSGALEFHDCGVVYHPTHPYLLCVMTQGSGSFDDLKSIVKNVSQAVYSAVEGNYQ